MEQPRYMTKLLEELGWNQGTRIPLADRQNQLLENTLIDRQNEIQRLKEETAIQKQKQQDLNKYKDVVLTEAQENTRILFSQKCQLEQEVKLRQIAENELVLTERDLQKCRKQSEELNQQTDKNQGLIASLLKRAEELKSEVCEEKEVLQDWRAAIERNACDIDAIEKFTKEDAAKFKELDYQRQKLKMDHDRVHDQLTELMSNLAAEEKACERISTQVLEGIQQRKDMMKMWTGAVENLRQRDTDIRHTKEDYAALENDANRIAEECREQQAFHQTQRINNEESEREKAMLEHRLSQLRAAVRRQQVDNALIESNVKSIHTELENTQMRLEKTRAENRNLMECQRKKDQMLSQVTQKIRDLKAQLAESMDKTKSSEKRAKELEDMLNEEQRYASHLTTNQQHAMQCTFKEQQKLLALQNEEKLCRVQVKASKAIMNKLDSKEADMKRKQQVQNESLYGLCYQLETTAARVLHMEGALADKESNVEFIEKEKRLKEVLGRHTARVALLERHSEKLNDDLRRMTRELEEVIQKHAKKEQYLKCATMDMEGGNKLLKIERENFRRDRVEEALLKLRVAQCTRALSNVEDSNFSLEKQRLHLDAAINERMVEIEVRREMFTVQRQGLRDLCGRLRVDIHEREARIEQLQKRYEIFISSLGKDECGGEISVAYFKIKFATERAELQERGASLDREIKRSESELRALEAAAQIMQAAHTHFVRNVVPLPDNSAEIQELEELTAKYYELADELRVVRTQLERLAAHVAELRERRDLLQDKNRQLAARQADVECELENSRDRRQQQESRLENAHEVVRQYEKRARKLVEGIDPWRIFQLAMWNRDYTEAHHNAIHALSELCPADEPHSRFAALLSTTDLLRYFDNNQRRLSNFVQQIIDEGGRKKLVGLEVPGSVFSSSESTKSTSTVQSGYMQRISRFRKSLSRKLEEPAMVDPTYETEGYRSKMAIRVLNLGLGESVPLLHSDSMSVQRKQRYK